MRIKGIGRSPGFVIINYTLSDYRESEHCMLEGCDHTILIWKQIASLEIQGLLLASEYFSSKTHLLRGLFV